MNDTGTNMETDTDAETDTGQHTRERRTRVQSFAPSEDRSTETPDEFGPERDVSFRRRVRLDADDSESFECVSVSESR